MMMFSFFVFQCSEGDINQTFRTEHIFRNRYKITWIYTQQNFTLRFSGKSCLGQELLHLMLYTVVLTNHFETTGCILY